MSQGICSNAFMNRHEIVLPPSPCIIGLAQQQVVMHNKDDSPCARDTIISTSQGDTDENGQRCTLSNRKGRRDRRMHLYDAFANDWVIGGSSTVVEGLMYSLANISPLTMGTSVALCDQMN